LGKLAQARTEERIFVRTKHLVDLLHGGGGLVHGAQLLDNLRSGQIRPFDQTLFQTE